MHAIPSLHQPFTESPSKGHLSLPCCRKWQYHRHLWDEDLPPRLLRLQVLLVLCSYRPRLLLLGSNFLDHYQLLVDVAHSGLINISSYLSKPPQPSLTLKDVAVVTMPSKFQHIQKKYPEVFHPKLYQFRHVPPKHGIYHRIKTLGFPLHASF